MNDTSRQSGPGLMRGRKVSWSNILAVLAALLIGAMCTGCASTPNEQPRLRPQLNIDPEPEPIEFGGRLYAPLIFFGAEPFVPDPQVRAIWSMMQRCLERPGMDVEEVRWAEADAILDMKGKQLLWGVVSVVHWPEGPALTIMVDRTVRHSARVLSHESIHVLGALYDGDWRFGPCQLMRDGPHHLPARPLTDAQVAEMLAGLT